MYFHLGIMQGNIGFPHPILTISVIDNNNSTITDTPPIIKIGVSKVWSLFVQIISDLKYFCRDISLVVNEIVHLN